jgi:hypothetical protein
MIEDQKLMQTKCFEPTAVFWLNISLKFVAVLCKHLKQDSKLTYVCQSVTDKNLGGHINLFTY